MRNVRVRVVADPAFREAIPQWYATASDLLDATSEYWEERFGVRLVPAAIEPWPLEQTTSSSVVLMELLQQTYPRRNGSPSADIVIGLTKQQVNFYGGGRARADRIGNCPEGLGTYIVSYVGEPFTHSGDDINHDVLALVHEMGHLFGATHTTDRDSVMNGNFAFRSDFDRENTAVVLKNRLCAFAAE